MTYRQAILSEFSDEERICIAREEIFMGMAAVLCGVAWAVCKADMPSLAVGDDEVNGNGIEDPSFRDVLNVLSSGDFVRSVELSNQTRFFLDWLLDQEIDTDASTLWYSSSNIGSKWNEFAELKSNEN